ncbi:MAG: ATP-binding cassette domain-containing protein, partial [Dinghuibacter sp.]|nr:ATP-binding cassette domain-containing protein [Dinghuibacter sp.]
VTFAYANGQPVVHNCSFVVHPGEKAVLSGANGSGKSTVLRLFTGSYSGFTGSILVNDMPIGNYQLQALRSCTGIMSAQMDIFKGTLWENITLGRTGISTDEVLDLAREIGLHSFIASRKEGLETLLEPAGSHIPAGVSRKILLLRALVNRPRLLLLEEPWQGFDPEEKQRIQQLLLTRFTQTTVLVVTNDADFIRQCNRNIFLTPKN